MSDEQFVDPGSEDIRTTEPVRADIDEPRGDERVELEEPEEDDSWLYECSITAD